MFILVHIKVVVSHQFNIDKKNCTFVFAAMFSTWYFRFYLRQPDVWKYYFGSFLRLTTSILELLLRKKFFDFVEIIKMPREGRYLSNFIVFSPYLTSNMTRIFFIRSYLIIGIWLSLCACCIVDSSTGVIWMFICSL